MSLVVVCNEEKSDSWKTTTTCKRFTQALLGESMIQVTRIDSGASPVKDPLYKGHLYLKHLSSSHSSTMLYSLYCLVNGKDVVVCSIVILINSRVLLFVIHCLVHRIECLCHVVIPLLSPSFVPLSIFVFLLVPLLQQTSDNNEIQTETPRSTTLGDSGELESVQKQEKEKSAAVLPEAKPAAQSVVDDAMPPPSFVPSLTTRGIVWSFVLRVCKMLSLLISGKESIFSSLLHS